MKHFEVSALILIVSLALANAQFGIGLENMFIHQAEVNSGLPLVADAAAAVGSDPVVQANGDVAGVPIGLTVLDSVIAGVGLGSLHETVPKPDIGSGK